MRSRDAAHIWRALDNGFLSADDFGWRIPTGRVFVEIDDRVGFYQLGIVHFTAKTAFNGLWIGLHGIAGNLDAAGKAASQIFHELTGMIGVTLPNDERGNQLGVGIQGDERPDIAIVTAALRVFLFGSNKSPNLVHLNLFARQAAHLFIHNALAAIPDPHGKIHDGVAVYARDALDAADARAFGQHGDYSHFLFSWKIVCHIFSLLT